ncbi:DNA alkylation repair protein [Pedobacter boryungensis]|uniref:HEAT repeat domain-containing protein n=1 Tax=Pedobacter boryungensis TaxID=869962 RepID=A0ABX2DED5_9SPHI|nr:DNA alkylation repair protein [Pedobacter boryungensis]NQX32447.1 HEAT repeat domain-containing protein [Pedobacter boryungensis]
MKKLIEDIKKIEHGFKHIIEACDLILADKTQNHFDLATKFLIDPAYQVRMLATYLLGQLSTNNESALKLLETKVADDKNWRVQEMLAKAFDYYCNTIGYEKTLPKIKKWLTDKNPNIKRAVIEGLRIWTSRPYFKDNPITAIQLISEHKSDSSEYLRKSVGNALRDISKKHKDKVLNEIATWDLTNKNIAFTYKLVIPKA